MRSYYFNARDVAAYFKYFSVPSYLEVSYMQYVFNLGKRVLAEPLTRDFEQFKREVEQLQSDIATKDARIKELEAEVEELKKKPLASPVPQRTDMSDEDIFEPSEKVKGTKFENACRILGKR